MIPVVMSGGSGSRLWPVSRASYPKQFCELLDESLFEKTLKRLIPLGSPWTITVRDLKVLSERALKAHSVPVNQVVYEPFGKNTAPAIALICKLFELKGMSQEIVGIFPADHLVEDEDAFRKAVLLAESHARNGHIVTLGIQPTSPATGYGYIETSGSVGGDGLKAVGFREKPNEETARDFLARGGFYWNAGMFIFKVSVMSEALKKHAPDVAEALSPLKADLSNLEDIYRSIRSVSIDYAVMERIGAHVCVPCRFGWSDLGSWDAIAEVMNEKPQGDTPITVTVGGGENFVYPSSNAKKIYGFVGVDDLIIVDTADALLIARKGSTERVKEVVDALKTQDNAAANQHIFEIRPWGRFEVIHNTDYFKSKTIIVDAGAQISYQSHALRAEHWVIVKGSGEVVLNDEVIPVAAGKHVYIPVGAKHRIRNNSDRPLEFVEVQVGAAFEESDIVRYQDDYQRN